MTTDHKELCFGLRLMGSPRAVRAADSIEQQAARIAELQRELETARQERNAAGVKARRELMPAYEARIAELEKERDALREYARQFYNLTQGDATVIIRAPSSEKRDAIIAAANRLRAALQSEKETR